MKIIIVEKRVYDIPASGLEPEVLDAIKHQNLDELGEFLSDLSDWPAESINTVSVEVARERATSRGGKA